MNRISQTERERIMRRQRRTRWRKAKQCMFTLVWLVLLIVGLICQVQPAESFFNPALRGVVTRACPARRRNNRQPNQAAASYSRYSTTLQDDTSIETQQDRCDLAAVGDDIPVDRQFQFADRAVSGTKLHRDALDAMLAAAEAGRFSRVYFFSLSRLARESVIGLALIKRLVYVYKVRVISVTEGLDSSREGWELLAQVLFMQHERYIKELSANTLRGQQGNIANKFSNGDYCFGYSSEPVPGTECTRRGRHRKPRMRYIVDPANAEWVRRVFHWFAVEMRSVGWIVRELNRLNAPKDHRSTTRTWRHALVVRLLANIKFIGLWPWGTMQNVRDPETGTVSQDMRPEEESQQWLRRFPELQLVDDEVFLKAQQRLRKNADENRRRHNAEGQFGKEQSGAGLTNPLHLLSCLIVCAVCGSRFYVGGANGKYLFCPNHARGTCACRTKMRRDLATRLILAQVSQRMLQDPVWLQQVVDKTIAAWQRFQSTVPNELRDTEAALVEVNRRIQRMLDLVEGDTAVDPDIRQRIADRRAERQRLEAKLDRLRQAAQAVPAKPTVDWMTEKLSKLHEVLTSGTPAAAHALRDLVSGQIVVTEVEAAGRKRPHFRGEFLLQINSISLCCVPSESRGVREAAGGESGELVSIDFVDVNPLDARAEQAKALWDQGLLGKEIAQQMACSTSQVTKLLKHWQSLHRENLPSGHSRRMEIYYASHPPVYQRIAEDAFGMHQRSLLLAEIADNFGCDINTVTKALRYWCETHDLPYLDGRTRRKGLERKSRPKGDDSSGNSAVA